MKTSVYWLNVLSLFSIVTINANRLPCLKFSCLNEPLRSLTTKCDNCLQCRADGRRFCLLIDDECRCADPIPHSCAPKSGNNSVEICYVPANSLLRMLDMNTDDDSSITIEIDRFWENEDETLHFRNLTLNAVYAVKDLVDCADHGRFAKAKLIGNNLCFTKYRIPMPSIDYTSDDNYYYDDHQNPMVQFDRQIFDETIPLTFWHEVRARKLFRLPINITVFFQYPMRSNNITYSMSAERGSPTIRSVSKSDELLQVSDSDMDDQDRSIDINLDGIKIPGVYKNALMHKLLTKYFTQMVIGSIALMFLFLIAFGVLVWFCCANEETKNFSKVNPRRTHAMHANVVDSSL